MIDIIEQINKIQLALPSNICYSVADVDKFFNDILLLLAKEFDSPVAYFFSLNRAPEDYEQKIEKIYKTKTKGHLYLVCRR